MILLLLLLLGCMSLKTLGDTSLIQDCSLISSDNIKDTGTVISKPDYKVKGSWYSVDVPSTVLAGLVQNNVYPDPFFGDNLRLIPTAPFDVSWWYRCEFTTPVGNISFLTFKGINYKANVWLDGSQVGTVDDFVGTFRYFDVPVPLAASQSKHAIALEVFRPHDRALGLNTSLDMDLAISFVDWNPYPPDSNMGEIRIEEEMKGTGRESVKAKIIK